ncbi:metallophosphoesterase family protein [Aliarcobacter lanthieri]|uniref:metallophosphoesterase family protein n=1 Tax=Aliarcobacter lanthieri TaxID=1355374 RepID=UPI003AA8EB73
MNLLHISDPHFKAEKYNVEPNKALDGLVELINKKSEKENLFILLTGDITSKGNKKGFEQATRFFNCLFEKSKINSKNFIVCPGNHDCDIEKHFEDFNTFAYSIREDHELEFDTTNSNRIYIKDNICFLSINTAYHLESKYGKVDIDNLQNLLRDKSKEIEKTKIKIILCHHHILNLNDKDSSAIKNSYQLFELLRKYNFNFLFHGHQHSRQLFKINNIQVNSTSSLLETRTNSNLIAYYEIRDVDDFVKEEYTFLKDETNSDGRQGSYRKIC